MKKCLKYISLVLFCFVFLSNDFILAQEPEEEYCILTCHRIRKGETRVFYWAILNSDIDDLRGYPMHICQGLWPCSHRNKTEVSQSHLKTLKYPLNEDIPIFDGGYIGEQGDDLNGLHISNMLAVDETYSQEIYMFLTIVEENKREVQRVTKKWRDKKYGKWGYEDRSRQDETIIFYLTPIKGRLQRGWKIYHGDDLVGPSYSVYAYCPTTEISYNEDFWQTDKSTRILQGDFSYLKFWEFSGRNYDWHDNLGVHLLVNELECKTDDSQDDSQNENMNDFVVFSFQKRTPEETKVFYWLAADVNWDGNKVYPINTADCSLSEDSRRIINKHKKEIQKIIKSRYGESPEVITVYATPFNGGFEKICVSGKEAYIPTKGLQYNRKFWKSRKSKIIGYMDLSFFRFWEGIFQNTYADKEFGSSVFMPAVKNAQENFRYRFEE